LETVATFDIFTRRMSSVCAAVQRNIAVRISTDCAYFRQYQIFHRRNTIASVWHK